MPDPADIAKTMIPDHLVTHICTTDKTGWAGQTRGTHGSHALVGTGTRVADGLQAMTGQSGLTGPGMNRRRITETGATPLADS